nr:laminin subunit alpha-like isoform X2 [Pocillopora verrucosa]
MSRFALNKVPRVSSKTQLFLTCFSMILMNSEIIASGLPYSEPPSFKIGEKIRLETILSCGTGAFQNKQDSVFWCDSMKEDDSNQTNGNQSDTCSACDPLTNASYSIKSVLTGNGVREWRSLPKDKESILQELNITINFPQILEIQSISVKAGKTPLPAVWALETTIDVNSDFQGVRYYVKNQDDCLKHFGVSLLDSPVCHLQSERSWTESKTFLNHLAASVQLRFLKMWPVVEARNNYSDYYSISDISIEGRCVCNGHTDECSPTDDGRMACHCRHNTCGERCQFCCEGYSRDDNGDCEACRCNKQGSASLVCNQYTGRCSCKLSVRGRRCDECPVKSYGFPTCLACDCNLSGSYGGGAYCDPYTGQCPCRYGFRGRQCDKCPAGYYNFPNCQWCGCNPLTTISDICEDSADGYRCLCKPNYEGLFCGQCKKGYYGFPVCKRCTCSPRGYGSCNELGKCVCNDGYAGIQCDRCANGYYGFPNCRACNCNTFGSYSRQCNYTTGECSCKPDIRGIQCDRCAENMVGFPACIKCDCNADGTRFLPGFANGMCYGSAKYQCLCKSNVVGRTCDRCLHGFYNFSGSNPLGCTSCSCSHVGTVSGTRNCHAQNGRCECKNHVIGKKCQNCRDGYHGMKSHDIFGCKACKCDPGGSVRKNCFKHLGNCQCISGVRGKKCDSLYASRATYYPTLYHTYVELERAVLTSNTKIRVPIAADDNVFPSFSGVGYAIFPPYKEYAVVVAIPKTSKYHVIFHYALRNNQRSSAKVELYLRGSLPKPYNFEVQFPPRNPSEQQTKNLRLTVNKRGVNKEFELDKGAWTVAITSHSTMLLLDYIVFLPQDYYNADLLNDVQPGPCMLRTSKPEGCDMYTYYDPRSPSIVTVSGNRAYTHPFRRQAYLFTDTLYYLDEPKLSNMALLGESQPILGFDITVPESGPYVVMATYVHPERFIHRVSITIGNQRGTMEILPCKYQFLCRQFAMDGNKRPKNYELKARQTIGIKIESSASAKIGVSSVTVIPQAKWNIQYIEPRLLCRMVNKTCFPATYPIPENAFQLVAFSHWTKDKMTSIFNGAVKAFVSYRIIIHYRQSNSLSKKVEELSITSHQKPNIPVTFHYCPADPGCRVVVGEEEALNFVFNRGIFTAKIQHERRTQLSYLLLVPQNVYSTSLLELQSSDKVTEFLQSCGKDHFHINPVRGRQCRQDVFSLTMRFIGGPLRCTCNVLGSRSSVCEEFGGQCLCRTNVVGRKCDRCKLGHAGFPRCRRCGCHVVGSVSPTCSTNGRCRCKPGFGGYKCDRCISSTYYGFPNCKPCACNTRGSLSTFCRSRDGQCQCRRNFNGKKCNECRIGYYDFPSCKKCSCEPAGIKLLPGEKNGCGSVDNTNCRCKDNVMGDKCDSCKPFHFNLRINNPLGCQSCGCNTNGSLGLIKTCHETTGQCLCKSHVTGRQCDQCKEGYYSIEGPNAFGCKRCSCNAGGSLSTSCNEITGQCPCLPGIGGNQCDRVKSNDYYYPTLHQYKVELEDAISTDNGRSAYSRYDESEFPGFSWRGYAVFSQSQTSIYMMIDVPRTSKYQLVFYYLLARYATVTALVRFTPTVNSGSATEQTLDVRFRATSNWFYRSADFLVVRDTWGDPQQIMLSQGKWKFTMSASATDLFVDYMVLLPEEYYKPKNLEVNVFSPCTLRGDNSHCSHLAFPSLKQDGFVTIQAEDSSVVGGVRRNRRVTDIPFHGLILTGSRNEMSFSLPSKVQGQFVLLASYFHDSDKEGVSALVVKTGSEILRAQMSILSCRYRFGCRQVAINKNHDVAIFTASQKEETTVSMTTSLTIALDFITAVPLAKWTQKLLLPATQCISNGFSCVQSTYFTPKDAVKVEAEDRLNGGDKAPYYIMDRRARLKHLKVGEKTLHINGRARTGRYYVIVHFYQPNFLSFLGKVVVSGQNAASTLLTFSYCPHVSGCRAIGTSQYREGMRESIYIGRQNEILVSIAIPEDKGVWIDYVLLVPISSFSPSLLDIKPIDITQDFIQDCGQRSFFLKESTSQFCLRSAFILTTRFNSGALSCNCDSLGATKTSCEPFGGQCVCRPNVIGRACDKCKSGYSGFPYCKR